VATLLHCKRRSFSLNSKTGDGASTLVDLSAVVFSELRPACNARLEAKPEAGDQSQTTPMRRNTDREGGVLDVVHPFKPSALMGAVCSSSDPSHWPEGCQAVPGDDVIHVMPKLLEPAAEVRCSDCCTDPKYLAAQNNDTWHK
jgi:hypothetical protein